MVDHRRTPSNRAYSLPGWFFVLTGLLSVIAIGVAAWIFLAEPLIGARTVAPMPTLAPTQSPTPTETSEPEAARDAIDVNVLNASDTPGLAGNIAAIVKEAGWTVGTVSNWTFGAAQNAVYYPDGHEAEAELLAGDLGIGEVRANINGMSDDNLTVLLISEP